MFDNIKYWTSEAWVFQTEQEYLIIRLLKFIL